MAGGRPPRDPVVLLPAMLGDRELWAAPAQALGGVDAQVVVHELTGATTLTAMAERVLRAAPPRFAVAGISLGGMVAMELLRVAPERITRAALLNTNPRAPTERQRAGWAQLSAAADGDLRALVREQLLPSLHGRSRASDQELHERTLDMAVRVGAESFRAQLLMQASRIDMRPQLAAVECPVLAVVGDEDDLCPLEMHEEIVASAPHSALVVVPRCGHLSTFEQPEAIAALLQYWLQQDPRRKESGS